ncbi:MAG: hypothetical protein R3279_12490 [Putridiphycobacter sp.]|nr:hypothetical protein [Putridiphycobacter sp.]
MKEEDNIRDFFKDNDIQHFDIKPEWLDDMSSKLDTYNANKKGFSYYWLLLLVVPLAIVIAFFLPASPTSQNGIESTAVDNTTVIEHQKTAVKTPSTNNETIYKQETENLSKAENELGANEQTTENVAEAEQILDPINHSKPTTVNTRPSKESFSKVRPKTPQKTSNLTVAQKPTLSKLKSQKNDLSNSTDTDDKIKSNTSQPINNDNLATSSQSSVQTASNQIQDLNIAGKPESIAEQTDTAEPKVEQAHTSITAKQTPETKTTPPVSENKSIIDSTKSSEKEDSTDDINNIENEPEEDITVTKKKSGYKVWSAGFTLGPDLLQRQLSSTGSLLNFEQKKAEEQIKNTWGFDFELNRYLTPWLAVGTGIGFKSYQEINKYSSIITTTYDTTYTIESNTYVLFTDSSDVINQDSTGNLDTTWVYTDSIIITEITTDTNIVTKTQVDSSKKVANGTVTSSYVQIPINAQLIFINTEKLTAYTNLGLTIGLLTKNTGLMIEYETNNILNYNTRKMIYNSNIGLGINYNFFGPLDYKLYGAYQFSLTNYSLTPSVEKRYNGITLRTGLVFHF